LVYKTKHENEFEIPLSLLETKNQLKRSMGVHLYARVRAGIAKFGRNQHSCRSLVDLLNVQQYYGSTVVAGWCERHQLVSDNYGIEDGAISDD